MNEATYANATAATEKIEAAVVEQPTVETPETPSEPVVEQPAAAVPTQREIDEQTRNFRAIRDAADRATRERDEALQRLQQYERQSQNNAPQYATDEPEINLDELNIKDDELAEGKHLQKLKTTIKKLEAKQKQLEQQSYTNSAEVRLRAQYNDFDKVMTLENIRLFSAAYPELAKSINASNDLYDKAVSAYTLIKRFGIHDEQPYIGDKNRALENIAKPRPTASVSPQKGDSPLEHANVFANGLTKELKEKLRKEMAEASKRY